MLPKQGIKFKADFVIFLWNNKKNTQFTRECVLKWNSYERFFFCVNIYKHMTWKTVYYIDDKYIRFVQFAPIISCCFHKFVHLQLHLHFFLKVYILNYDASHFKWNHRKKKMYFFRFQSVHFINKIPST